MQRDTQGRFVGGYRSQDDVSSFATGQECRLEAWAERYAATPERPSTFTTLSGARVHATEGEIVAALQHVWG
jgi:hypothetical protein